MRIRLAAAIGLSAIAVAALPGHAAPAPQITDATGDAVVPESSLDIVSALFATTGKKVGKKYVPNTLVVTVTYAAAPNTSPLAAQAVEFTGPCGAVLMERHGGGTYGECGDGDLAFTAAVKGNTIVFTAPFAALGGKMKAGTALSSLRTWTGGGEPTEGIGPEDIDSSFVADEGLGTKAWKVA